MRHAMSTGGLMAKLRYMLNGCAGMPASHLKLAALHDIQAILHHFKVSGILLKLDRPNNRTGNRVIYACGASISLPGAPLKTATGYNVHLIVNHDMEPEAIIELACSVEIWTA